MSSKKYVKLSQTEHVLKRPSVYIGSIIPKKETEYIFNFNINEDKIDVKCEKKEIKYSQAILRVFIEALSNAIDNLIRSKKGKTPCKYIRINYDKETKKMSVMNDGEIIPIEMNEEHKMYNHTLIFGNLLTSSNYDDDETRDWSGLNGMGIKLLNIFSTFFAVSGLDPINKKVFYQEWHNNMKDVKSPIINTTTTKRGFTKVEWILDFQRFGIEEYTEDILSLFNRYIVETSVLTKVDVYYNDILVPVKSLMDYSKLILNIKDIEDGDIENGDEEKQEIMEIKTSNVDIIITRSKERQFEHISFVNGIHTKNGGTHINAVCEALFRPIVTKLSTDKLPYNIGEIKKYFTVIVVATCSNPVFDSQQKHMLESPFEVDIKKADINKILKWKVIADIKASKEMVVLKKLDNKKRGFVKVEGLDQANLAGTKQSTECTLILVEGLSAKTFAVKGIEVGAFGRKGRDFYGIFALSGKVLNVRNAKPTSIADNKVVSNIVKALGLIYDRDYTDDNNFKTLKYGRVLIISDQDCDGIHINALIQNIFHYLYPSLLRRKEPFVTSLQTPIVRVFLGKPKKSIIFYDERKYKEYVKNTTTKIDKMYYKGLGTSTDDDIKETFGKKILQFKEDDKTTSTMIKAFHKDESDTRKNWMTNYDPEKVVISWSSDNKEELLDISMSDFIDTELIKFSLADCQRSIPHLMDGLKESHRKTLYACILKNLKYTGKTLKVAQLAGFVAEKTGYHHGEGNLYDTITKMAHRFVGSNNIPLLFEQGQFGSRLEGGADAASARYIYTKMDKLTRLLFNPDDDVLLESREDDGDIIEPKYYVPIIPTILVNGATSIGTGWSCNIPCYNPVDIVNCVKLWLNNKSFIDENNQNIMPDIIPWYNGYTGRIIKDRKKEGKYISYGNVREDGRNIIVDELPVGYWTNKFKDNLDDLLEEKKIKSVKNYSTPDKVHFVLTEIEDGIDCDINGLKLYKYINTSNMVLFDINGKIKKYNNIGEIIHEFCLVRYDYYVKRKKHNLSVLNKDITFLGNKRRFLQDVLEGNIKLFEEQKDGKKKARNTNDLYNELEEKGYDKWYDGTQEDDGEDEKNDKGYDYLLRLQFRSITQENIDKLKNDIDSKVGIRTTLEKTSEKQLWINDLDVFEKEYKEYNISFCKKITKTKTK